MGLWQYDCSSSLGPSWVLAELGFKLGQANWKTEEKFPAKSIITDYGLKNPIKTSEGYRGATYTINPATYFGFAIIGYSIFEQFMNLKKLRLAGEKLKKAGKKINE